MKSLIKQIDNITDFRKALKLWARAKTKASDLELDLKTARATIFLDTDGSQNERYAKTDIETEDLAREAAAATLRATALYALAQHLRGQRSEDREDGVS